MVLSTLALFLLFVGKARAPARVFVCLPSAPSNFFCGRVWDSEHREVWRPCTPLWPFVGDDTESTLWSARDRLAIAVSKSS